MTENNHAQGDVAATEGQEATLSGPIAPASLGTGMRRPGVATAWRVAGLAALGAAFAHNLAAGWLKWGDPVVDGGREMMMPARMLAGEVLYAEHRNLYGPLAPYINMALYRVFGVHLSVLQIAGATSAALMAGALYLLARRFVDRIPSLALTVAFLYAFAFAHLTPNPAFNFVLPYAYAATYGIVAATISLLFLVRHVQNDRDRDLAISVLALVLASLAKLEVLVPAAGAHLAWITMALPMRRMSMGRAGMYFAGVGATGVVYGAIGAQVGPRLWTDNLAAVVNLGSKGHVFETMGFDDAAASMIPIAMSLAAGVLIVGVSALVARAAQSIRPAFQWLVFAGLALAGFFLYAGLSPNVALRALPVIAVVLLPMLVWRFVRQPKRRAGIAPTLLLWVFSAGCLVRLGLLAGPAHYGFFLGPVPFVAAGVLLLNGLPGRPVLPEARRAVTFAWVGSVAGFAFSVFVISAVLYSDHVMEVSTPRGHMILRGERWQPELVAYLQHVQPNDRVVLIPQGAGLLFLAGGRMAGGLYSYAPMEMSGEYTDEKVRSAFSADPPDVVVFLAQDPNSFRYTGFGVDYGFRTAVWLRQNYIPVAGNREVAILRHAGRAPTNQ